MAVWTIKIQNDNVVQSWTKKNSKDSLEQMTLVFIQWEEEGVGGGKGEGIGEEKKTHYALRNLKPWNLYF